MSMQAKIIIIENDIPIAAKLSLQLCKLGYHIGGIFSRAKDALSFIEQESPDIILLDENQKGELNGIESHPSGKPLLISPVLYFNPNRTGTIKSFLVEKLKLQTTQLKKETPAFLELNKDLHLPDQEISQPDHFILNDRIFVRHNDKMVRISLDDIYYIEADRNYCKVYSKGKKYLLVCTLKEVNDKLTDKRFLRIHRSYIVNLSHIDEIGGNHVVISSHHLPLSKNSRMELFRHLRVI